MSDYMTVYEEYVIDGEELFITTFVWNGETKVILRFEVVEKDAYPAMFPVKLKPYEVFE